MRPIQYDKALTWIWHSSYDTKWPLTSHLARGLDPFAQANSHSEPAEQQAKRQLPPNSTQRSDSLWDVQHEETRHETKFSIQEINEVPLIYM